MGLLVCLAVLAACGRATPASGPVPPRVAGDVVTLDQTSPQLSALAAEEVQPRTLPVHHFTGRLSWDDEATVRVYAPVAGRVRQVSVGIGDHVVAEETLAVINSPDLGQAQADARAAEGALRLARKTLDRERGLLADDAAARKDVEAAEADYTHALSDSERARARLKLYGVDGGKTVDQLLPLESPIHGIVVERSVSVGQEVRPDQMLANEPQVLQPLFVISDPMHLWVWLDVPEVDLSELQPGALLTLHARAYPDREFEGQLDIIGAALDPTTRTVKARGSVANPDGILKAEMYVVADVTVAGQPPQGVQVPTKALFLAGQESYVFLEEAPGRYRRQRVTVGAEEAGRIAVVDGLTSGQRVITEGSLLLKQILDSASVG